MCWFHSHQNLYQVGEAVKIVMNPSSNSLFCWFFPILKKDFQFFRFKITKFMLSMGILGQWITWDSLVPARLYRNVLPRGVTSLPRTKKFLRIWEKNEQTLSSFTACKAGCIPEQITYCILFWGIMIEEKRCFGNKNGSLHKRRKCRERYWEGSGGGTSQKEVHTQTLGTRGIMTHSKNCTCLQSMASVQNLSRTCYFLMIQMSKRCSH